MLSALLGLIAVAEIGLLFLVIALRRRRPDWALSMLILVIMALIWDNAVIAVGGTLGEGEPLRTLSVPRYVTHALLVPLLIMVGVGLGRRHGIRTLAGRTAPAAFGALTVALVAAGLWLDVLTLELEPTRYADTVRYTNAASHGAPIPAVVTVLVLIGIGTALLVRARRPWLLAGSVAMFAAAAAAAVAFWIGNVGELLLILSVWWTAAHTAPAREPAGAAPPT
ncbi:hypothetical protein ACFQFC_36355 [Amorphoplanes digitatis]|uniref:Uncharacterized protein n=1 Tax=Actinoplanes digitatis TaxID=1868 RepID=A0A7W7MP05_9ACTN|nr:hypothetical protein [Actinoplanes digitatis]MBB4761633.1 hypothetical protein [Actinoplanes digitatis]GID90743.1 hypothetical protein Adi01nite_01550 [Actinoplanes digitatis]